MGRMTFDTFKSLYRCGLFYGRSLDSMGENDMEVIMSLNDKYRPKSVVEIGMADSVSSILLKHSPWIVKYSRIDVFPDNCVESKDFYNVDMILLSPDDVYDRAKGNTDRAISIAEEKGSIVIWRGCRSEGLGKRIRERNKIDSRICFVDETDMAFQIVRGQPEYLIDTDSRFCVVSAHTEVSDVTMPGWEGWGRLGRATMENKLRYCRKMGYGMMGFTGGFNMNMAPSWNKLIFMRRALRKHEWALWLDTDAAVMNMDVGLETFTNGDWEAVFEREPRFTGDINGGVFMLKRGAFSEWMITELLNRAGKRDPFEHPWEQEAINEIFREGLLDGKAKVFEDMVMGKHPSLWIKNDFAVHVFLAHGERMNAVQRLRRLENMMKRAGLDVGSI